jgi:uncharacterized protein
MALQFTVKITPNAATYRWKLAADNTLKCYLTSHAIEGRANAEFIAKLAKLLHLAPSLITIISGHTSRIKKVKINSSLSYQALLVLLNLASDTQKSIF